MTVNNRALALADELEDLPDEVTHINAASAIRFLVSFNQQLMDEVARLNNAVSAEREACAKLCEAEMFRETQNPDKAEVEGIRLGARLCAGYIRARGNTT